MKTFLLSTLFCASLALSAQAQRFACDLTAKISNNTIGLGVANNTRLHTADLLVIVANTDGRSLDPASLQLVYDNDASQIEVVKKSDGSVVAVVYSVVKPKDIDLRDGSIVGIIVHSLRQASLQEADTAKVVGTIAGEVSEIDYATPDGFEPPTFEWKAKFSAFSKAGGVFLQKVDNINASYLGVPTLIQGTFHVYGEPLAATGN